MAQCNSKPYFRVVFLAFLLPLVSGDCSDLDLGMESGSIPDSDIIASSTLNSSTQAKNGRLNYTAGSSWCADTGDINPYIQIDLQTLHFICAVSTQGNSQADEWVVTYILQTSTDGTAWTAYNEDAGQVKTFTGNNDRNTEEKKILYDGILTRWLRFVGKTKRGQFCMRAEVFGVKRYPVNLALKKPTVQSSTYNNEGKSENAVDGVRNIDWNRDLGLRCTHTNWENHAWWRVDLGSDHVQLSDVFIITLLTGHFGRSKNLKITLGDNRDVQSNPQCVGRYSLPGFSASAVCYNNPLRTGRYVGIMHTRAEIVALCEVEVYSRENLAYNKSTAQISDANSGVSRRAVDGNSDTTFSSGSCSHTGLANNPWWRVDLGRVEPVNQVYIVNRGDCCGDLLDSFEIRVGRVSNDGGVTNPICGDGFSVSQGEGASFFCRPSLFGQYVTIRSTKSGSVALTLCEVEVYSERRACEMQAMGLTSSHLFPDSSFSASSSRNGNEAFKGRLNGVGTWSPSTNGNSNDYLQINLQYEFFICAVATQGNPNGDHWTRKYKLLLSLNGRDWVTYQQETGTNKIFNGNDGRNDIVKHNLTNSWRARFIRFVPTDYHSRKALRVEVYGVLKPTVPFQPPDNFSVTPVSSTSITASWKLPSAGPSNGIIRGFKLFYKEKGSAKSENTELINNGNTFTKTVTGLLKYTEYDFQVLAFTSAGDGPKSSKLVQRTIEDVPSQSPTSFAAAAQTSTSIRASWQLPPADSRNGIIKGFKLFYKRKGFAGSENTELINNGNNFTKTVTKLLIYTEYEFKVLAFTSVGDGPKSSKLTERTNEDVPSRAPTSFTVAAQTSTSIRASWQLPPEDSRNGIIKGFKLFYKKKGSAGSASILVINDGNTFTKTVNVLLIYTEYEFQVLAFTSVGDGPKSSVKTVRTIEDAPSAPAFLNHTDIAPSVQHGPRVRVTWSRPVFDNGKIRNYTLFYSHSEDVQSVHTVTFGPDTFSYVVDVLGGVKYQFFVRAVTIKPGANNSISVDTREYVPHRGPENVSSTEVNYTTFLITWAALPKEAAFGNIIMYQVRLFPNRTCSMTGLITYVTLNTTTTEVLLSNLFMCTVYEVAVRAFTIVGPGPHSKPIFVQTLGMAWSKEPPVSPSFYRANFTHGDEIAAKIKLPRFPRSAKFFQVIVITFSPAYNGVVNPPESFTPQDLMTYEEAHRSATPAAYVTFQFGGNDFDKYQEFVVGNKAKSSSTTRTKRSVDPQEYKNYPLQPNTNYRVFLRAFVSEKVYISGNFVEIKTKEKPVLRELPERQTFAVGDLIILTCEVSGDPEPSIIWTKDGDANISRAQFKNNGRILVIKDILPGDKGVYECKASKVFGESRTATIIVVAEPPYIEEHLSTPSVICEKETLCFLSCHGTSDYPVTYSWNKNGETLDSNHVKVMNNIVAVKPRDEDDYGVYVCNASNSFGYTNYNITLSECPKCSTTLFCHQSLVFRVTVIASSCIAVLLLIVIGLLLWRLRRALTRKANNSDKYTCEKSGRHDNLRQRPYMELKRRTLEGQSSAAPEYQELQSKKETPRYYDLDVIRGDKTGDEQLYEQVGTADS